MTDIRPRRSVLYMPGSNARALDKARSLPADALILDLEDAVAPDVKETARAQVCDAVAQGGYGPREIFVRVNAPDTPWGEADLAAAAKAAPDVILIPKVSDPETLGSVGHALRRHRRAGACARVGDDRDAARHPALRSHRQRGARRDHAPLGLRHGHQRFRQGDPRPLHARTARPCWPGSASRSRRRAPTTSTSWTACITPSQDEAGFRAECEQGRDLGFDGKTLIHPNQIAAANAVFAPSAEEVEAARAIIAAFDRPENAGKGAISLDGRMVERLHAEMARRTVALADAIAARG